MKNFIAVAVALVSGVAFAGEKTPVAAPVKGQACATCVEVVPVRAVRRETVWVPATKTVTVYETKKVLVEKEVKVPVKKEVTTLVPAKVVSSCGDCDCGVVATPVRRVRGGLLGLRARAANAVDYVTCK